jgi:hypothetical protein
MKRLLLSLIIFCSPAWAAFVNSQDANTGTADCNMTLSLTSGNIVVVIAGSNSAGGVLSVSSSQVSSFGTHLGPNTNTIVTDAWVGVVTSTNASAVIDVHDTSSANFITCSVAQFSTTATVDKHPAAATYSANTTQTAAASGTLCTATETVVGAFANTPSGASYTAGSGFTIRNTPGGTQSMVIESQDVSATTTITPTTTSAAQAETGVGYTVSLAASCGSGTKRLRGLVISR